MNHHHYISVFVPLSRCAWVFSPDDTEPDWGACETWDGSEMSDDGEPIFRSCAKWKESVTEDGYDGACNLR